MSYFSDNKRGELPELQNQLSSHKIEKKRDAVKKIIAAMTIGKDVSSLFPHVIKCMQAPQLDLKKLVYLYIINYAKSQPDLAIMAVNSFRKDSRNPSNPLIRALAVRTMGCIRVERITEYLCQPLKDALNDQDAYVRKTAAVCVAKLFDIAPDLVQDDGFLDILKNLLSDGNAMVVSNSVAALNDISESKGQSAIRLDEEVVNKVVTALGQNTEWGQVYILDFISKYTPGSITEAEGIIDRVLPRLAHSNPAVVISASKVVLKYMDFVESAESIRRLCRQLTPSLVSLLGYDNEIQYISLKCINLIVQKRPNILQREIKVFFCKYNDPIYVKLEKIQVMVRLADHKNIDSVLFQLKQYATEVDVDFVKKSVRAIGRCAIKLQRAVDRCIAALLDLINLKVNYVIQQAIIVIRDIFRRYPNRYQMIIKELFSNLQSLDNPEAKASIIWILGEYAQRIDDATSQLSQFLDSFQQETPQVHLALLTATVKLFLKKPEQAEQLITQLLTQATQNSSNPDFRDRAYIYWRLLSSDPEAAKEIVIGDKPPITQDTETVDASIIDSLVEDLGKLSSVYHKPADVICPRKKDHFIPEKVQVQVEEYETYNSEGTKIGTDLIGIGFDTPENTYAQVPKQTVLTRDTRGTNGQAGLQIEMAFQKNKHDQIVLQIRFTNFSHSPLVDWAMQFNINYYGIANAQPLNISELGIGKSVDLKLEISTTGNPDPNLPSVPFIVQMAVKTSLDVFYFQTPVMFTVLLTQNGKFSKEEFKQTWQNRCHSEEFSHVQQSLHPKYNSTEMINKRLEQNNIFLIAGRNSDNQEYVGYFSCKDVKEQAVLCEIRIPKNMQGVQVTCKTPFPFLAPLLIQAINFLLATNNQMMGE